MKKTLGICAAVAVAAGTLLVSPALATQPNSNTNLTTSAYVESGHKVTICHRTGSASNPYVVITVDVAAIDGNGGNDHDHHEQTGNGAGGDVIPPVLGYNPDGKNWNDNWAPGVPVTAALCLGEPTPEHTGSAE